MVSYKHNVRCFPLLLSLSHTYVGCVAILTAKLVRARFSVGLQYRYECYRWNRIQTANLADLLTCASSWSFDVKRRYV